MTRQRSDPSADPTEGTKIRNRSKEAESSRDSRSKGKKSSSTSKDASQSQHKHSSKSAHAEEPSYTINDSRVQQDQEFDTGNNDEQLADKEVSKADWFKKPERPSKRMARILGVDARVLNEQVAFEFNTRLKSLVKEAGKGKPLLLIRDHRGHKVIPKDFFINYDLEYLKGGDLSRRYSTSVTKTKAATYDIKWIEDLFAANMSSSKDVYSRKRIIVVTRLTIMKKYDYGHMEEIEVRRDDQKLYKFREGDFPLLRLQDIKDMLLLLVQQKLTNLTIDERYDLNVALRMFTRRIVIQTRVEDLQLGGQTHSGQILGTGLHTLHIQTLKE
ncbi:hypothetical protein Tco_1077466 [Tanacetum coccineum]